MSAKIEKAKEILVSLICRYLIQISETVQQLAVKEGTLSKEVRETFVKNLNDVWKSILPRQLGTYNDKLYKQICNAISVSNTKYSTWLIPDPKAPGAILKQCCKIVLGVDESATFVLAEGELVVFSKVLEFLATTLLHSKELMVRLTTCLSPTEIPDDIKQDIAEIVKRAIDDVKRTVLSQREAREFKRNLNFPSQTPIATPVKKIEAPHPATQKGVAPHPAALMPQIPKVKHDIAKIRAEMEEEFHNMYTEILNQKLAEHKMKVQSNIKLLVGRTQELEHELAQCYELIPILRNEIERLRNEILELDDSVMELRSVRPSIKAKNGFESTISNLLEKEEESENDDLDSDNDLESSDESPGDNDKNDEDFLIDFAFEERLLAIERGENPSSKKSLLLDEKKEKEEEEEEKDEEDDEDDEDDEDAEVSETFVDEDDEDDEDAKDAEVFEASATEEEEVFATEEESEEDIPVVVKKQVSRLNPFNRR